MSIEEHEIDMGRFGDFDQLDLLDLVEGTMSPDRAKVLVQRVREKDPELLHRLVRSRSLCCIGRCRLCFLFSIYEQLEPSLSCPPCL